jgi:hypothetical protein
MKDDFRSVLQDIRARRDPLEEVQHKARELPRQAARAELARLRAIDSAAEAEREPGAQLN